MAKDLAALGLYIVARWSGLKADRAVWDSHWQEIAHYVLPRKGAIITKENGPRVDPNLYDTTAVFSNQTLANGMVSYMTPADGRWFAYRAPKHKRDNDAVKKWYQECTEVAQEVIANSNFNSEIHELYYDDGAFGTAVMYAKESETKIIYFETIKCGQYCLSEDNEGHVNVMYREIEFTVQQAADEWGAENLSADLQKELEELKRDGKKTPIKHCFIHAIYPRKDSERDPGKMDAPNMPIASIYVEAKSKHLIKSSGFLEQPFVASRHDKYSGEVYGSSPGWRALPDARQLNFLSKTLDAMAEIKTFPRTLIPDGMEGSVDMRAGGETYFDPSNQAAMPKEWATSGDYNIGLEREKRKQEAIERHFYVDMLRMFAGLDKQMTAREVAERGAEKLNQFTPAFARKTTEVYGPLLKRVFAILLRGGHFPPPPPEVFDQRTDGSQTLRVPDVTYTSRIALAMQALQNIAFGRTMDNLLPFLESNPELLDNFDLDKVSRDSAINDGVPAEWMRVIEERDKMREARAQAQQQAKQAEQAAMMAKAAGDASKITPDSIVGQALEGQ